MLNSAAVTPEQTPVLGPTPHPPASLRIDQLPSPVHLPGGGWQFSPAVASPSQPPAQPPSQAASQPPSQPDSRTV